MSQYHHLYNRAAWRKLRASHLRAKPLCRMHMELGQVVVATVVDHIKAHKGDLALFHDASNLQSLCKSCHDSHKQAQEHNADGILRGAGLNGKPLDLSHPWHRGAVAEPDRSPQGWGGQISGAQSLQTACLPSFAKCHNSEGGSK